MKFNVFNKKNSPHVRGGSCNGGKITVTFCKSGAVRLSRGLMKLLGTGKGLLFLQDQCYLNDWYITAGNEPDAFIPEGPDKKGNCFFKSSSLCERLSKALMMDLPIQIPVSSVSKTEGGLQIWPVATKQAKAIKWGVNVKK